MPTLTKDAETIFAPLDGGGASRKVVNSEVQTWGTEIEDTIDLKADIANGPSETTRSVIFQTNGLLRAAFGIDAVAESGSNAGSDVFLRVYNDAGGGAQDVFAIERSSGAMDYKKAWNFAVIPTYAGTSMPVVHTGTTESATSFPIGHIVSVFYNASAQSPNTTDVVRYDSSVNGGAGGYLLGSGSNNLSGTYRSRGSVPVSGGYQILMQRVA
jgi:hypothetical protein